MVTALVILIVLALTLWFWLGSMRAREAAVAAASSYCKRRGLQFLDDTVALKKIRFKRDDGGRVRFCRVYQFEYGIETRECSHIIVSGQRVLKIAGEDKTNNVIPFPKEKK